MSNNQDDSDVGVSLIINRIIPKDLATHFVHSAVVQHRPEHFVLSFFQTWDPMLIGMSDDERRKTLEEMKTIDSLCVSRIVVTPEVMRDFVTATRENFEKFEETFGTVQTSELVTQVRSESG